MNNHSGIQIRMARFEEAGTIAELIYKAFADQRSHYTERAFAITTPGINEVEERIRNKTVWVAVENAVVAGTASAVQKGEGLFVRSVAVDPAARRKGIAGRLMFFIEKLAIENDCKYLKLTTTAFLLPACRLYESLGFIHDGYKDLEGTELVKLKKNLNPFSSKIKLQKHDHIK